MRAFRSNEWGGLQGGKEGGTCSWPALFACGQRRYWPLQAAALRLLCSHLSRGVAVGSASMHTGIQAAGLGLR